MKFLRHLATSIATTIVALIVLMWRGGGYPG